MGSIKFEGLVSPSCFTPCISSTQMIESKKHFRKKVSTHSTYKRSHIGCFIFLICEIFNTLITEDKYYPFLISSPLSIKFFQSTMFSTLLTEITTDIWKKSVIKVISKFCLKSIRSTHWIIWIWNSKYSLIFSSNPIGEWREELIYRAEQ